MKTHHQSLSRLSLTIFFFSLLCCVPLRSHAQFVLSNIWSAPVNSVGWLTNDNAHRGIAVSPTTNHVYVVSRSFSNSVHILDSLTGAEVGALDMTDVSGGTFAVNLVEVADDGAIYVCNLGTSLATFKIYRWATESSAPVNIFNGDPTAMDTNAVVTNTKRFGDNMDLRGSGPTTQIIVNSRGGRASAIISPDPTLTLNDFWLAQTILMADVPNNQTGTGVAWASGNSYWAKQGSNPLRRLDIANPADIGNVSVALVATTAVSHATSPALPATTSGLGALPSSNLLAVIDYTGHFLRLFNTSTGLTVEDVGSFAPPAATDGNGVGKADFVRYGSDVYVYGINVNNGCVAFKVLPVNLPIITSGPANQTILEGGYGPLTVVANGTPPLTHYWRYHGTDQQSTNVVAIVTNSGILNLTNVATSNAGYYSVVVSNVSGSVTSTNALLTIEPTVRTAAMSKLWQLPAGSRPYLGSSDLTRGIAVNPVNGHVLVVTRVGSPRILVLDGATGADLWQMNTDPSIITGSAPGGFELLMIGVADDGVVYACNLNTGGANTKIYRWDDDSTNSVPTAISDSDGNFSTGRYGDTMKVRGAGPNTQILLRAQSADTATLLTTSDGTNFVSALFNEDASDNTRIGLAFGSGNTYWSRGSSNLFHFAFDTNASTATVLQDFPTNVFPTVGWPIGVDVQNDLLALIATFNQTPDNLRLFDIIGAAQTNAPVLLDQEFFGSDNPNVNAVGDVTFDVSRGRLFSLENNNGIIALSVIARLKHELQGNDIVLSWTGPSVLQSATAVQGPYTTVSGATSPHTNAISGTVFFRLQR